MRAILGFILVHAALVATGLAVLRALGLVPMRGGRWTEVWAIGPALLVGAALVVLVLIVLLVIGIPLNLTTALLVCLGCTAIAEYVAVRRGPSATPRLARASVRNRVWSWIRYLAAAASGAYLIIGFFALLRLPTISDDARIWSLRGLTLTYYHGLQPEIFQNQLQSGAHPIYPLFQAGLEALVFQAMGRPQLRLFHAELWLLFAVAIWTAGYLILRSARAAARSAPVWIAPLALVALTPAAITTMVWGWVDITGSVLLAVGALALAIWLERGDGGFLGLATLLLAAAASTKDEDLVAAVLVLLVGIAIRVIAAREPGSSPKLWHRLRAPVSAVVCFAVLVAPWRIWTAAHHLTDSVEPPLPHALSPAYIFSRTHQLHETVTAMLTQTLTQWGWLAAIFIVTCLTGLITRPARRLAWFYLASIAVIVVSLLWLYTTTSINLEFLLATSMFRTVDVFMVLAGVATAHLLARMPAPSLQLTRRARSGSTSP